MQKAVCCTCQKPKAALECLCCHEAVCKYCAQFLEENRFSLMPVVPTELQGGVFCNVCFDSKIQPQIEAYDQDVERTKDILIFMKKQTKETRHVKRTEVPYRVENCADESETLMRMAYMAMKAGFNSVVDVEATGKKVKLGAYQTSTWTGVGLPAHMDLSKIPKDRSIAYNPN